MQRADIPTRFPIPFADAAIAPYVHDVPEASQIGITPGAASLTDGFPPANFTPVSAGGVPPWGNDMNGILKQITQWSQWQAAGGPVPYDSSFSTSIGGYPKDAVLASTTDGYAWLSTADDNTVDPDTGTPQSPAAGWAAVALVGGTQTTGDVKWRPTAETLAGWVKANATTIGDGSSGASQLASASAWFLFDWLWTNFSNPQCPVLPSGRGATSAADFAAHKTIAVLDLRGTTPIGMDTMGGGATTRLTGVPATTGNATTPGSVLGENLHALIANENGPHTHVVGPYAGVVGSASGGPANAVSDLGPTLTTESSGLGTAHNTVQISMVGTMYLKL